jgi:hypothetical protein
VTVALDQPAASEPATPPKFYTPRTTVELLEMSRDRDMVQARRDSLLEPHIGKWLRVEGPIDDIRNGHNGIIVDVVFPLAKPSYHGQASLAFDRSLADVILALDKKDLIRAEGRIRNITFLSVNLESCELIGYEAQTGRAPDKAPADAGNSSASS